MSSHLARFASLTLAGSLALGVSQAQAQDIAPRVMIVFDTSGSMLWDNGTNPDRPSTRGDGSVNYPGNDTNQDGIPNDSRLFIAKEAIRDILLETDANIEFGLMRFHQDEGQAILRHDASTERNLRYQTPINYTGWNSCTGNNRGADTLVDVGPNSRDAILGWIDGVENWPNQKELRGTGYTPLAYSLEDAKQYFEDLIASDPQRSCRNYFVVLITDGINDCGSGNPAGDPGLEALGLRATFTAGQFFDIKTFVVGFGPTISGAEGLNQIARAGGTAINDQGGTDLIAGQALFASNRNQLRDVLSDVLVGLQPNEVCDGRDNDCDGDIDEDFPTLGDRCEAGVGECLRRGEVVCSDTGTAAICDVTAGPRGTETCNNLDDDCDGQVDEGTFNACGTCGAVPTEACDGNDNDCDGQVDEGVLNACGRCGAVPNEVCNGVDDDCDGQFDEGLLNACGGCGALPAEVCDGADNDCDNLIDEGFDDRCGDCVESNGGVEICDGRDNDCDAQIDEGVLNACGECGEVPREVCNGADDDCDGDVDEDSLNACGECGPEPRESCDEQDNDCDGQVDEGTRNACNRCGADFEEACDNVDNDCDGRIDEDAACPDEKQSCVNGECVEPCQAGECFNGRICQDNFCVTPCSNANCPPGFVCQDGECADACRGIDCPAGSICWLGACTEPSCEAQGCPSGEVCRDGSCQPDACADLTCDDDQGCRDGLCFDTCLGVVCPAGELCEGGLCFPDACAGRNCAEGLLCEEGACVEDPCASVSCPAGQACDDGRCREDDCLRTTCPEGTTCRLGDCIPDEQGQGEIDDEGDDDEDGDNNGDEDNNAAGEDDGASAGAAPSGPEACHCSSLTAPARSERWAAWLALSGALIFALRRRRAVR